MPISMPPPPESATRTNPLITLTEGATSALIPLSTETIARTFQQDHDLVILLTDGNRITLADFFVLPDPALILRNPTTGDHTEIRLGEKGTLIGQQPRSVSELAELFTSAELTEWQAAETTRATTPETSTATATQTSGSGTGWTTATRLGVLAGSAAVLTALTTAARGTNSERPEGAANQTETETDGSESSEGSGAGTDTDTTETDTDTQGGETDTEGDEEDTDAGMPTDQGTDTDEGTDAETSEETPDTDTDTHNPPQPVDPATHGDTDGEDASTDSDDSDRPDSDGTEGSGETSTATAGTNTNTDDTNQQDSDQDNTPPPPAPPVDPNAETEGESGIDQDGDPDESVDQGTEAEGANIEVDGAEGAGGTDSTAPEPDAGAVIDGPNPMPMPQPNSPGAVSISGTATEDQTLTATVTDTDTLPDATNIRYQWQRSDGSGDFENIANATGETYTLGDADVGRNIRAVVNYTDGRGTDESPTSDATTTVTNINDDPSGSVSIDGTVEEDQTLTANTDNVTDADGLGAFSYQWQRSNGSGGFENIENATGQTYTLGDADVGREVRVQVSYTDGNNTAETVTSDATNAVSNINDAPTGSVTITGTVEEDQTLTANTTALQDADGLPIAADAFTYQWQRNTGANDGFENIENATSKTYTLGDADVGREVRVQISYTDGNSTDETVSSDATVAVGNVNDLPTGSVTITGTVEEDQILTANVDNVADEDGLGAFSYQWQRSNGNGGFGAIENATSQTYILDDADVGREVQVMVSYTDDGGMDESVTSAAAPVVENVNDDPSGSVSIDGTVEEDQQLSANISALADADGLPIAADAFTYQWQRSDGSDGFEAIENATGQTYTLGDDDVGREVRVQVNYTDANNTPESLTSDATNAVSNINDSPSGSVTIDGTAEEDQILTANVDNVTDADGLGSFSYQWQRSDGSGDFENIANATGQTYSLGDADVGRNIRVVVNYTDGRGTDESPTSDATTTVTNINDDPTGSVSIDGTAREDETLTANVDNVTDADGLGALSYQWQRSNDSSFENIAGETGNTYTLGDTDVGQTLRVQVSYRDQRGADERLISDATLAVTNVNDEPTGSVSIDGTVEEDQTLTANTDTLADDDGLGTLNYQWQRSTNSGGFGAIENATSRTYTLGDGDVDREVRVQISYTDDGGMGESLTSTSTAAVENVNDAPSGSVTIDGTVSEDQTLTANITALQDADGLPTVADAFTYQWQSNTGANGAFEPIAGATSQNYTLGDADVGREVRVEVRYTDGNNTDETVTSTPTTAVSNINDSPSGSVTIDGTVREDETLTTNTDNLDDADGLGAFSYQWQRSNGSGGFENIENATGQTYTLGDDDVGREVRVQVNYTDANNTPESLTSDATAAVNNVNDSPTGDVSIDGTATEDETLTANTSTLDDADGLGAFSYQWQRSDGTGGFDEIPNATSNSYTLGDADVGHEVQVQVNYTDARGEDEMVISDATAAVGNVNDLPTGEVTIDG